MGLRREWLFWNRNYQVSKMTTVSPDTHDRELGEISANIKIILKQQDEIFQRLNLLSVSGCALGHETNRRLERLENRTIRTVDLAGRITAIISGVIAIAAALIAWIKSSIASGNINPH